MGVFEDFITGVAAVVSAFSASFSDIVHDTWRRLNARTLASPALVDGKWYFRTDSELIAIGN